MSDFNPASAKGQSSQLFKPGLNAQHSTPGQPPFSVPRGSDNQPERPDRYHQTADGTFKGSQAKLIKLNIPPPGSNTGMARVEGLYGNGPEARKPGSGNELSAVGENLIKLVAAAQPMSMAAGGHPSGANTTKQNSAQKQLNAQDDAMRVQEFHKSQAGNPATRTSQPDPWSSKRPPPVLSKQMSAAKQIVEPVLSQRAREDKPSSRSPVKRPDPGSGGLGRGDRLAQRE